MKRRSISPFSLSFLDIMFCGFGAVVLLVLILNTDTVKARNQAFSDLRADVVRLEKETIVGREHLVRARNSLATTDEELVITEGEAQRILRTIRDLEVEIARMSRETLASREHINRLQSDVRNLDAEKRRLGAEATAGEEQGSKVHRFVGEGDRQYLTGLKVGGRRILILVDASASMLAETIINVVRRRNMSEARRRAAPKWQRALATYEWLIGNLPADALFQVYTFNTRAKPAVTASEGKWLSAARREDVARAVEAVSKTVPGNGTSLYHAFAVAKSLTPRPDNILLITDGLPTQGRGKPGGTTVSAEKRLAHFERAMKVLPGQIPVNTILLPMEGDIYAAAAFWNLAMDTRGSFLTPARDWP